MHFLKYSRCLHICQKFQAKQLKCNLELWCNKIIVLFISINKEYSIFLHLILKSYDILTSTNVQKYTTESLMIKLQLDKCT